MLVYLLNLREKAVKMRGWIYLQSDIGLGQVLSEDERSFAFGKYIFNSVECLEDCCNVLVVGFL